MSYCRRELPIILIIGLIFFTGCSKNELTSDIDIYFNDFESNNLSKITGGRILGFNGRQVIGNYNNDGFQLLLENIPDHNYIQISYDLLIHDSWDGNTNELNPQGQDHDSWIMEFDRYENIKASEKIFFETTFSNGLCVPGYCYSQSFPSSFPFPNEARQDATSEQLPGQCLWQTNPTGTSLYTITQIFPHSRSNSVVHFYDKLVQTNSANPICDESWSLDNLAVMALTID